MVHKTCAECGVPLGDVHGNTQYCEGCVTKRRREQNRESKRRQRDRDRGGTLIPVDGGQQIADTLSAENQALILRNADSTHPQFIQFLRQAIKEASVEFLDEIHSLTLKIDELMFFLQLSPETLKKYHWTQRAITEACNLLQELGESLPLHRIRQILQQMLKIDKQTAEKILREAHEQIRWMEDLNQRRLDEFDQEED